MVPLVVVVRLASLFSPGPNNDILKVQVKIFRKLLTLVIPPTKATQKIVHTQKEKFQKIREEAQNREENILQYIYYLFTVLTYGGKFILKTSVADPDSDPLVRGMDPDPDPSIIKQN